jgi:hypothetical protein
MSTEYRIIRIDTTTSGGITDILRTDVASSGVTLTLSAATIDNTLVVGGNVSGGTFYGDGSKLTGISADNFYTTGVTINGNSLIFNRNDALSAYTVDLTQILDNTDTKVTGFTYNNANTFTISQDNGQPSYSTSINIVTGLTVTNYIDYTTNSIPTAISGRTYFDRIENALSYFPDTPSNDVTINIGQESVIRIYNGTGQQINNGEACHIYRNWFSL